MKLNSLYDDAEWYFEKALTNYIHAYRKNEFALTDQDYRIINEYAGNHIAFFMTWIIKNKFESDLFSIIRNGVEAVEAVRKETITGTEFLFTYCDGKLDREMLCDEILSFADQFYEKYYFKTYYVRWVITVLHDLPLEFGWSWEDYHSFEKILNQRYSVFLKNQKAWKKLAEKYN